MKKTNLILFLLIILLLAVAAGIYMQQQEPFEVTIEAPSLPTPPEKPAKMPIVHYPVPDVAPEADLSPPAQSPEDAEVKPTAAPKKPLSSDAKISLKDRFQQLIPNQDLLQLLLLDDFIPRLVVTIDNLPEKKLPHAHLPLKKPQGRFLVSGTAEAPQTSPRNHQRYEPYVVLLESLDVDLVINTYQYFYPRFQKAYRDLGYPNAYFNDRLIQVLDHLQETPDIAEPIPLEQPQVLYLFASSAQEKLSAGQKILLRIGPHNRQRILKVLAEYRQRIVTF